MSNALDLVLVCMHYEDAPGSRSTSAQDLLELLKGICSHRLFGVTRSQLELRRHDGLPPVSLEVPEVESVDLPRKETSCLMHDVQLHDDTLGHGLFDKGAEANHELEATEEVQDVHTGGRGIYYLGVLTVPEAVVAEAVL